MRYTLKKNILTIKDAYLISKHQFDKEFNKISNLHPECLMCGRTFKSIRREWAGHKALYLLGKTSHKDAVIDITGKSIYCFVGFLAWIWLK